MARHLKPPPMPCIQYPCIGCVDYHWIKPFTASTTNPFYSSWLCSSSYPNHNQKTCWSYFLSLGSNNLLPPMPPYRATTQGHKLIFNWADFILFSIKLLSWTWDVLIFYTNRFSYWHICLIWTLSNFFIIFVIICHFFGNFEKLIPFDPIMYGQIEWLRGQLKDNQSNLHVGLQDKSNFLISPNPSHRIWKCSIVEMPKEIGEIQCYAEVGELWFSSPEQPAHGSVP